MNNWETRRGFLPCGENTICIGPAAGPRVKEKEGLEPKMNCVPRLERDTTLSVQCPVDHISDWELIEIGMLPGQIDCCCSKERIEESPSAQWLMSSLRERRV